MYKPPGRRPGGRSRQNANKVRRTSPHPIATPVARRRAATLRDWVNGPSPSSWQLCFHKKHFLCQPPDSRFFPRPTNIDADKTIQPQNVTLTTTIATSVSTSHARRGFRSSFSFAPTYQLPSTELPRIALGVEVHALVQQPTLREFLNRQLVTGPRDTDRDAERTAARLRSAACRRRCSP